MGDLLRCLGIFFWLSCHEADSCCGLLVPWVLSPPPCVWEVRREGGRVRVKSRGLALVGIVRRSVRWDPGGEVVLLLGVWEWACR